MGLRLHTLNSLNPCTMRDQLIRERKVTTGLHHLQTSTVVHNRTGTSKVPIHLKADPDHMEEDSQCNIILSNNLRWDTMIIEGLAAEQEEESVLASLGRSRAVAV